MAYTNLGKKTVLRYDYVYGKDTREEITKNINVYEKNGKFYISLCGTKNEVRKISDDVFRYGLSRDEIEDRKKLPYKEQILQLMNDGLHPQLLARDLVCGFDDHAAKMLVHSLVNDLSIETLKKQSPFIDYYINHYL